MSLDSTYARTKYILLCRISTIPTTTPKTVSWTKWFSIWGFSGLQKKWSDNFCSGLTTPKWSDDNFSDSHAILKVTLRIDKLVRDILLEFLKVYSLYSRKLNYAPSKSNIIISSTFSFSKFCSLEKVWRQKAFPFLPECSMNIHFNCIKCRSKYGLTEHKHHRASCSPIF